MNLKLDHISVCICTYKRPVFLSRLLRELQHQITEKLFTYSIVVVDNDYKQSAKEVVASIKKEVLIKIDYDNEPEKNFALVRNKAVNNATGNLIAFIDDDELPLKDWLLNLYKALYKYSADGVLGPVKPEYEKEPPKWIIKGRFCERTSFKTGNKLSLNDTRTGNVLLKSDIFKDHANMFDARFGTGSEDSAFFDNLIKKGHVFIACNEAPVYETVPPERMKTTYFIKRAFLDGANSKRYFQNQSVLKNIDTFLKSILACCIYSSMIPFTFIRGYSVFMKYFYKNCYHFSRILAYCKIHIIKERNF